MDLVKKLVRMAQEQKTDFRLTLLQLSMLLFLPAIVDDEPVSLCGGILFVNALPRSRGEVVCSIRLSYAIDTVETGTYTVLDELSLYVELDCLDHRRHSSHAGLGFRTELFAEIRSVVVTVDSCRQTERIEAVEPRAHRMSPASFPATLDPRVYLA